MHKLNIQGGFNMDETQKPVCKVCGTKFVPAKEPIKMDGSLTLDGSFNFGNEVCPKCHPELAKEDN